MQETWHNLAGNNAKITLSLLLKKLCHTYETQWSDQINGLFSDHIANLKLLSTENYIWIR